MSLQYILATGTLRPKQDFIFRRSTLAFAMTFIWAVIALSGCAALEGKFAPSKKADVGYFADQTISMLSQTNFAFTRDETVYTRDFVDLESPADKRLYALEEEVETLFQKIIDYSMNLVVIYETNEDNEARVAAYADRIEIVDPEILRQIQFEEKDWKALFVRVRKQKKFMAALETAHPIMNGVSLHINALLNQMVDATDQVALEIEQRIDERFVEVARYYDILLDEKYAVLAALEKLYRVYAGEKEAYQSLRESEAIRKKSLIPRRELSEQDLEAVGQHLMKRLDALHRIGQEIEPEWEIYRAAHMELDKLYDKMLGSIRIARMLTMIWVHAHYQMASGKTEPAEWFDIKNTGMAIAKTASSLVF